MNGNCIDSECKEFKDILTCAKCEEGLVAEGRLCVTPSSLCKSGEFKKQGVCHQCASGCGKCFDEDLCVECADG